MKKTFYISAMMLLFLMSGAAAQSPVVAPAQKKPVMLTGGTIHTGTGEVIADGAVVFEKGKITSVGKASDLKVDKTKYDIVDVSGKHVYPGLIFPNTGVGLSEIGSGVEVAADLRETGDLNPNVRAIAAYNTDSHVIPVLRSNGILLAQIVPQGTLLTGTSSVVQLDAWNWEDAAYSMDNGMHIAWPRKSVQQGRGAYALPASATPVASTYDRNVEQLDKLFSDAVAYSALAKPEKMNLRLESMKGLFDGSKTLFITAPEAKGIVAAVNFARNYGVKKIVLTNAGENALAVKDFLRENNIPVIVVNPLSLPEHDYSDTKMPFRLPALFMKEGILTGITYGSQAYANLPFAAGQTVAYGMSKEQALQAITLNNARILGIADRTGSIEAGKDANIVVSTGDILDMAGNNVELAYISGRSISLDNKHKQLYRRFEAKYENMKEDLKLTQPAGIDK